MKRKYYMRGLGTGVLVTAILCSIAFSDKTEPMTDEQVIARAQKLGYRKDEGGVTADDIDKIKDNSLTTGKPDGTKAPEGTPEVTPEGTPKPTLSPVPTPKPPDPPDLPNSPATPPVTGEKVPTQTVVPRPTATTEPASTPKPTAVTEPVNTPRPTAVTEPVSTPRPTAVTEPVSTPKPSMTPEPTGTPVTDSYTIVVERGATARRVAERLAAIGAVKDSEEFIKYLQKNNLTDFINIGTFTIPNGADYEKIARILTK